MEDSVRLEAFTKYLESDGQAPSWRPHPPAHISVGMLAALLWALFNPTTRTEPEVYQV